LTEPLFLITSGPRTWAAPDDRKKLIWVFQARANVRRSALAFLVIGILVALVGLIFTLQGLGYVGPVGGLMYNNSTWVTNGEITFVAGAILAIVGFALNRQVPAPLGT
jgi:hypothetical protein